MRSEPQPATAVTQEQIDGWLGSGPEEREALRTGSLPPRLQRMISGSGCVSALGGLLAIAISAAVGAGLLVFGGRLLLRVGPMPQLLGNPYALGLVGALAGALVGLRLYRSLASRGDKLAQLSVTTEEIDVGSTSAAGALPRLTTAQGRVFRAVLPIGTLVLPPGRYRAFYVDFAQLADQRGKAGTDEPLLLALEPISRPGP